MYRIALLDDEIDFLDDFKNYFIDYKNIDISLYTDPYLLIENIDQYDAIYIDYQMPLMNAFEFIEKTSKNHYLKIIITNYDQMIFDSLKYDIFYFVRKQNIASDFPVSIQKLLKELDDRENNKLILNSYNTIISLYYNDIKYIETDRNYIIIHALKDYKIRCTFKKIIGVINNKNYIIISYGIMVNMKYVMHIDFKNMTVMMNDGSILSLSKKFKNEVKDKYKEYRLS